MNILQKVLQKSEAERMRAASTLSEYVTPTLSSLGFLHLLLVIGWASSPAPLSTGFLITAGVIWAVFSVEFFLRLIIAPNNSLFLKTYGWHLMFVLLPPLVFIRSAYKWYGHRGEALAKTATLKVYSAGYQLVSRFGWLTLVTSIIWLSSSQVLYKFGEYKTLGRAMHDSAFGILTGEPLTVESNLADVVEILLAAYSVLIIAAAASIFGIYFLRFAKMHDEN